MRCAPKRPASSSASATYIMLAAGPVVYLTCVIAATSLSVTLAVLTAGSSLTSRVLAASFFHWWVNSAMLVFLTGGAKSLLWTTNTAIATVLVAVAVVLLNDRAIRKRLVTSEPRSDIEPVRQKARNLEALDAWFNGWRGLAPNAEQIDRVSPAYIPRNHLVEKAPRDDNRRGLGTVPPAPEGRNRSLPGA